MTPEQHADKLMAVAEWFTDCKTLTLENMPHGLIAALKAGAVALRQSSGTCATCQHFGPSGYCAHPELRVGNVAPLSKRWGCIFHQERQP